MKIPVIRASQELPVTPVTATTQGAGRTWDAVAQLGERVNAISQDLAQTQQRIRMTTELAQAEIDMVSINKDIETNLRLKPNPDTYVEDWGTQFTAAAQKRLEGVKSAKTRAAMEQLISQIAVREIPKQKDYANRLWEQTESAKRIGQIDSFIKDYRLDKATELIDRSVADGLWNPEEAAKWKIKETDTYNYSMAQREIDLTPEKADEIIEKYNISPERSVGLQERAVIVKNANEAKLKKAEQEAHDQEENVIADHFLKGEYKEAFDATLTSKKLKADEKWQWDDRIKAAQKEGLSIEKPVTDYKVHREQILLAYEGRIRNPNSVYDLVGKGLTMENAKEIRQIALDSQNPEKAHELELTKDAITTGTKRILKPDPYTLGVFMEDSEDRAFRYRHALKAELEKEQDYAKRIRMLTPGTNDYIIDKLVNTYKLDAFGGTEPTKGERKPLSFYER